MKLEKDDFCDNIFLTEKSKIIIKGKIKQQGKTLYLVECNVCSSDKELFPDNLLLRSKASILKGSYGCGCCRPKWTEGQYRVLVKRICESANYTFLGWNGEYIGNKTKLLLKSNVTDFEWGSTDINKLLIGRRSPEDKSIKAKENATKADIVLIEKLMSTGMFLDGTIFCRSKKRNEWLYRCPRCSKDEYVSAGICTGIFTTNSAVTGKTSLSCRCSLAKRYSMDEKIFKISSLMREGEYFLSLNSETTRQTFNWVCSEGHEVSTSIDDFIYGGNRCKECSKTGFSELKTALLYLVKLEYQGEYYIKYGITNRSNVSDRIAEQTKGKVTKYEIKHTFYFSTGKIALTIENTIKNIFKGISGISREGVVSGYTETLPYSEDTMKKLITIINEKAAL